MRRWHASVGWTFLVVFLATGAYLRFTFPEAYSSDMSIRYLFRASHVYILFSALLNIMASGLLIPSEPSRALRPRVFGSLCLLLASPVFLAAFFLETSPADPARPLTLVGAFLALAGVLALHVSARRSPL